MPAFRSDEAVCRRVVVHACADVHFVLAACPCLSVQPIHDTKIQARKYTHAHLNPRKLLQQALLFAKLTNSQRRRKAFSKRSMRRRSERCSNNERRGTRAARGETPGQKCLLTFSIINQINRRTTLSSKGLFER